MPCPLRDQKSHKSPCKDCENSFEVFSTLLGHARDAQTLTGVSKAVLEDYQELEKEIVKRRQNLIDLRSHMVRKKAEDDFYRHQMQSLKSNQCLVVSDFKMKILAMYYRENMKLFYGKRGTSCLGFMVITNTEQENETVDVHFYLLFSDDTTQDANFVLSAKAALFETVLPNLFPEETEKIECHFRADGAGCFNCNVVKAAMPMWLQWTRDCGSGRTKVDLVSFNTSVNGDGKTSLDAKFAHTTKLFQTTVNNGNDITSSSSCVEAFQNSEGIRGTSVGTFTPVRENIINTRIKGLNRAYHLKKNHDGKSLQAFSVSDFGEGEEIMVEDIMKSWTTEQNPPTMPTYIVSWLSDTEKSNERVQYSTERKISRVKRCQEENSESKRRKREDAWEMEYHKNIEKGLHYCSYRDPDVQRRCVCSFLSERSLRKHEDSGNHRFKSHNLVDSAVSIVAGVGDILAAGTHHNRLAEYNTVELNDGEGLGQSEGGDWFSLGCYLKPEQKPRTNFTLELKTDLLEIYLEGETSQGEKTGKSKYTKTSARQKLEEMKDGGPDNLRKYSSTSTAGPLPEADQIKGIFAAFIEQKNKLGLDYMKKLLADQRNALKNNGSKIASKPKEGI